MLSMRELMGNKKEPVLVTQSSLRWRNYFGKRISPTHSISDVVGFLKNLIQIHSSLFKSFTHTMLRQSGLWVRSIPTTIKYR